MKPNPQPTWPKLDKLFHETSLWSQGFSHVAGLDEAGRGAWAGPVVAAAVIFKSDSPIPEVDDSKNLTPRVRESLFEEIMESAISTGVAFVAREVIDEINILQASLKAMCLAIDSLKHLPQYLLIDGNQKINSPIPQKTIIGGDGLSASIGAASILAKVSRDKYMSQMENEYPHFNFSKHKGYGTKCHQEEIKKYGPLPVHRLSFKPFLKSL